MTSLMDLLALRGGGVISIVGAGGKTSLMERLASEILAGGETVLVTTTTKIMMPRGEGRERVLVSRDTGEILNMAKDLLFPAGRLTAAREYLPEQDKLVGFSAAEIGELEQGRLFNWILVEADGARRLPLKAPASHEPVIPPSSRWVIAVVGLDGIGKPLTEEWVFRSRLFADLTGLAPGAEITEESVAAALVREKGILKDCPLTALRYVFLNKADTEKRRVIGSRIAHLLRARGFRQPGKVIVGALEREAEPLECYDC